MLCDGCDVACHVNCAGLDKVPEEAWFCAFCAPDGQTRTRSAITRTINARTRQNTRMYTVLPIHRLRRRRRQQHRSALFQQRNRIASTRRLSLQQPSLDYSRDDGASRYSTVTQLEQTHDYSQRWRTARGFSSTTTALDTTFASPASASISSTFEQGNENEEEIQKMWNDFQASKLRATEILEVNENMAAAKKRKRNNQQVRDSAACSQQHQQRQIQSKTSSSLHQDESVSFNNARGLLKEMKQAVIDDQSAKRTKAPSIAKSSKLSKVHRFFTGLNDSQQRQMLQWNCLSILRDWFDDETNSFHLTNTLLDIFHLLPITREQLEQVG